MGLRDETEHPYRPPSRALFAKAVFMEQWSILVVLMLVLLAILIRLPWRRARMIRVESRIGRADVEFDPLPPSRRVVVAPPTHEPPRRVACRGTRRASPPPLPPTPKRARVHSCAVVREEERRSKSHRGGRL